MELNETVDNSEPKPKHVAIGVFANSKDLSRAAEAIGCPEIEYQRVSLADPTSADDVPAIMYDPIDHIETNDVNDGIKTGSLIGFSSGLIAAIPAIGTGVFIAAPLAGLLTGAFIGCIAGIDEAQRAEKLPNPEDYEVMLKDGKALLVIEGDEQERERVGNEMKSHGAHKVYQHPPLHEFVRNHE